MNVIAIESAGGPCTGYITYAYNKAVQNLGDDLSKRYNQTKGQTRRDEYVFHFGGVARVLAVISSLEITSGPERPG